jgi:AMP-binding enzyme
VERGVSTGECMEADPLMVSAGRPDRAVTDRILDIADEAGYRAALVDAAGTVTAWPRFAWTVRAAARGLGRRGLVEADTAGVFVDDAASAAIAVNAIRAAGATACLIRHDAGPADIAARLDACGARLLITSAPLAELAAEGADRSRVRQIISFGEAVGTTPFGWLVETGLPGAGLPGAGLPGAAAEPGVLGEPGRPEGNGQADHHGIVDGRGDELTGRDVVVATPPCGDGQAYLSLLDFTLLTGAMLVAAPLPLVTAAMRVYRGTAAIVPRGTAVPGLPLDRIFPVA